MAADPGRASECARPTASNPITSRLKVRKIASPEGSFTSVRSSGSVRTAEIGGAVWVTSRMPPRSANMIARSCALGPEKIAISKPLS